jgi:CRP/FNR family transcriptional regulator, nitrogen oxide reductase regulator
MVGQLPLEQHIGVRIPGGQPIVEGCSHDNVATIRGFIARYPHLTDNTMLVLFGYLTLYRDTHVAMTYDAADQRVAHVLTNLANTIGKRIAHGIEVDVRNEELANEANVTLFTVSRLISAWRRQGILTKSRGKVLLRSPEQLLQRV